MIFKNRETKYNILFSSNLSISNIAKVMDVSESTVLKAKCNILGELANSIDNADTSGLLSSSNINLDNLVKSATFQAYKLEEERDNFYKKFYIIANSYISSHFKYKELTLQSAFKNLTKLNAKISSLEKEINNS
uniref:Uncharacterized protein n=1 Tax=Borrelia lonestari TaxID=38876 RepID=A4ZZ17_9SPIR|nr:hypothetical protein [Borrelia lonestari]